MKASNVENIVVDEAHHVTYVVMGRRVLTDGEMYSAIRVERLRRGGKIPAQGDRVVIIASEMLQYS